MTMITGQDGIEYAQLAALKGAVRLEKLGMRHSSGRSMRARAARLMRLRPGAKHDTVINALQKRMDELLTKKAQEQAAAFFTNGGTAQ